MKNIEKAINGIQGANLADPERAEAFKKYQEIVDSFDGTTEADSLREQIQGILRDAKALPKASGKPALDEVEEVRLVDAIEAAPSLQAAAAKCYEVLQEKGFSTVQELFNAMLTYVPELSEIIWEGMTQDPTISEFISKFSQDKSQELDMDPTFEGDPNQIAQEQCKTLLTNQRTTHIHRNEPGYAFMTHIKHGFSLVFAQLLKSKVINDDLPLVPDGEAMSEVEKTAFSHSFNAALNFRALNLQSEQDMLRNSLGQAQTANYGLAIAFFKQRESIPEEEIGNNFSYVYLSQSQTNQLELDKSSNILEFEYYGEPYFAVPVGIYFQHKDSGTYNDTIKSLQVIAHQYPDTPVSEYFTALEAYYNCGQNNSNLGREEFIRDYYHLCYQAERAWVKYVKYAAENGLPFISVHPFENYGFPSTKLHDFSLALNDPTLTEEYMNASEEFRSNISAFFKKKGLDQQYPEMTAETIKLLESTLCISLAGRIGSGLPSILAQMVPNEEPGRREGMIDLMDTPYSYAGAKSSNDQFLKQTDPLMGLHAHSMELLDDFQKFLSYYKFSTLSHELNHSTFKGKSRPVESNNTGLAISMIEEAKATSGICFMFSDPENLTDAEIQSLREVLPLIINHYIGRLNKGFRRSYTSHQYLREGAVMLDHCLKSGLVRVHNARINQSEGLVVLDSDQAEEKDFSYLQYDLSNTNIQDFIARQASFMLSLAKDYAQSQGFDGDETSIKIDDRTDIDTWQILGRLCAEEHLEQELARGQQSPSSSVDQIRAFLDKLTISNNSQLHDTIKTIISIVEARETTAFKKAISREFGEGDDKKLAQKIAEIQSQASHIAPQVIQ